MAPRRGRHEDDAGAASELMWLRRSAPGHDAGEPVFRPPRPRGMENIIEYTGVTLAISVFVWGMIGFVRGLSLPRNEHRLDRTGDTL